MDNCEEIKRYEINNRIFHKTLTSLRETRLLGLTDRPTCFSFKRLTERETRLLGLTETAYMLLFHTLDRARDEARTRDLQLGRLSLYQLSYSRIVLKMLISMKSGEWWIRTTEAEATDLQSVPFSHSGNSPHVMSHLSGSNQRPTDYKSVALPAELKWHFKELAFEIFLKRTAK
jgi:hypothetical protein